MTPSFYSDDPKHVYDLKTLIESTLLAAQDWFTRNGLKIHSNKTEMFIFQSKRIRQNPYFYVRMGSGIAHPTQSAKVLGVVLDRHGATCHDDHISLAVNE